MDITNITKGAGRKIRKILYPFILLIILLAVTLPATTPVGAMPTIVPEFQGPMPTAIALSDYTPGATTNCTIYFMLRHDWPLNHNMVIDFPFHLPGGFT